MDQVCVSGAANFHSGEHGNVDCTLDFVELSLSECRMLGLVLDFACDEGLHSLVDTSGGEGPGGSVFQVSLTDFPDICHGLEGAARIILEVAQIAPHLFR